MKKCGVITFTTFGKCNNNFSIPFRGITTIKEENDIRFNVYEDMKFLRPCHVIEKRYTLIL